MCTVIGIIGTIALFKIGMRALRCHHGGGCGPRFGHHRFRHRWHNRWHRRGSHGPIHLADLADLDEQGFDVGPARGSVIDVPARLDEIFRSLELNARQAAEAGDVVAALRGAIGPERFASASQVLLALRAVGRTPFDVDLAEAALGPRLVGAAGKEARDALEHLHNILTEEQRTALQRLLTQNL
jgi:hypothetical protein